ncbi:MAG: hypothetical protein QOG85_1274 [Gaiellaceae bacterium]|jgi:hypothetical protein|nr:hypothetical protein [Gaiellaceae bacterium]
MEAVRILVAIVGGLAVAWALLEAVRAFVIPRGVQLRSRVVFLWVFRILRWIARVRGLTERTAVDGIMVYGAPIAVLGLPLLWLITTLLGFAGIFWAIDGGGFGDAVVVSGSSLFTLGFEKPDGVGGAIAAFADATIGLGLLALVITYLPTLNAAFSRREAVVAMLDARAGSPPDALTLIERHHIFTGIETLDALWPEWERWIVDVGETHYTHPMLVFFRSSEPDHSWVTATATLLEAANFRLSAIEAPGAGNAAAWMFYRAGLGAVGRLRGFFANRVADREVEAVDRGEFERVLTRFEGSGVSVTEDHDLAWERFCRRRADYEPVLDALARLVDAPAGLWPAASPEA